MIGDREALAAFEKWWSVQQIGSHYKRDYWVPFLAAWSARAAQGPARSVAEGWYRAQKELDLTFDGPYEALVRAHDIICQLRAGLAAAQHALRDVTVTGLDAAWLTGHWTAVQDARQAAGLDVWQPWMAEGVAKGAAQPPGAEEVAQAAHAGYTVWQPPVARLGLTK